MQLSQMHARTNRFESIPEFLQPDQTSLADGSVAGGPNRRDPWLPNGIAMDKRRVRRWNPARRSTQLLRRQAAAGMGRWLGEALEDGITELQAEAAAGPSKPTTSPWSLSALAMVRQGATGNPRCANGSNC